MTVVESDVLMQPSLEDKVSPLLKILVRWDLFSHKWTHSVVLPLNCGDRAPADVRISRAVIKCSNWISSAELSLNYDSSSVYRVDSRSSRREWDVVHSQTIGIFSNKIWAQLQLFFSGWGGRQSCCKSILGEVCCAVLHLRHTQNELTRSALDALPALVRERGVCFRVPHSHTRITRTTKRGQCGPFEPPNWNVGAGKQQPSQ